jgi:RHS repeat-associated protein
MNPAAKERMASGSTVSYAEAHFAAMSLLAENSPPGFTTSKSASHPGIDRCNSTVVLGLQATLLLNRLGSRCTGKERDSETGLDYFGARYYGSNMGRFASPDEFSGGPVDAFGGDPTPPGPLPYADITNPQSLNKYSYTYNNPLRYTDPDGHCPTCVGDLIELIAQNPEAVAATLDGIAKATAATEAGLETAASTTLRTVTGVVGFVFLASQKTANEQQDTIQGHQQQQDAAPEPATSTSGAGARKGGGRDERKANPDRVQSAKDRLADLKQQRDALDRKTNKTPADKEKLDKLKRAVNRETDRMKKSETHSRKEKGQQQ